MAVAVAVGVGVGIARSAEAWKSEEAPDRLMVSPWRRGVVEGVWLVVRFKLATRTRNGCFTVV